MTWSDEEGSNVGSVQPAELNADLKAFLRAFTHDIGNPLTSVLGYGQLLQRETNPEKIREHIDVLLDQARHCRRLIEHLQQFVDPAEVRLTTLCVNDVVHYALGLHQRRCESQKIEVSHQTHADLPKVLGDVRQIRIVLSLVLENAVHALEKVTHRRCLQVRTRPFMSGVCVEIEDNGCGLEETHRSVVFEPTFTTRGQARGLGLGLPTALAIMHRHQGDIHLEEAPEKGLVVRLEFPRLASSGDEGDSS